MENRLKLRLPRLFRSSLSSCRPRNSSDVVESSCCVPPVLFHRLELVSPKARIFPSFQKTETAPRPRVSEQHSLLFFHSAEPTTACPPASPIFSSNPYYQENESFRLNDKDKKKDPKNTKKKSKRRNRKRSQVGTDYLFSSSSLDGSTRFQSNGSWCWSSSDGEVEEEEEEEEEEETDMFFSSRSFSSDTSTSRSKNKTIATTTATANKKDMDESTKNKPSGEGKVMKLMDGSGKVKDSFAVVKRSKDPYEDFRTSMVEMIVERQIFGAADLEQLLRCFLALNSCHHHRIIVQVFLEIYETLFSR